MDRLADLQSAGGVFASDEPAPPADEKQDEFFTDVSSIQEILNTIHNNITQIEETYGQHVSAVSEKEEKRIHSELEKYINGTTSEARRCKQEIEDLEKEVSKYEGLPAEKLMQTNIVNGLKREYVTQMRAFREVQQQYKTKYKERILRQVKIVHPEIPEEDLEEWAETHQGEQLFEQGILEQRSKDARVALEHLRDRQNDLKKLEESIIQLHELFVDFALIVESQTELLDQVESAVMRAVPFSERAVIETRKALQHTNWRRRFCCPCCV